MKSVHRAVAACFVCCGCLVAVAPAASAADAAKSAAPQQPITQGNVPPAAKPSQPTQESLATPEMKAAAKAKDEERKAAMRAEPKVDINNASKAEIAKVLMISEADAGKIIAARPIRARTDIVTKAGLPEGVYQVVRSRIIINEPRKQKPASTK